MKLFYCGVLLFIQFVLTTGWKDTTDPGGVILQSSLSEDALVEDGPVDVADIGMAADMPSGSGSDMAAVSDSDMSAASVGDVVTCPGPEIIRSRARCRSSGRWVDCFRDSCCPGYTLIVGRCIPETEDPCSPEFGLCEQQCSLYFGRVVCTCHQGYSFNKTKHSLGIFPACEDVDECSVDNGGCEGECNNTPGQRECGCSPGFRLAHDTTSCTKVTGTDSSGVGDANAAFRPRPAVTRLQRNVDSLEERFRALNTAIKLYSFAGGSPGPAGPSGPVGPPGPRGFPGPAGEGGGAVDNELEVEHDSWTMAGKGAQAKFCTCARGPVGSPGAAGQQGPQGPTGPQGMTGQKGQEGSFDFLMVMVADMRHDIESLMERTFGADRPKRFDLTGRRGD